MRLSIIAAIASNGVIGRDNALPWRLKPDLARFKRITMGGTLIMGRRTFESIGRALPGRTIVVVTRTGSDVAPGEKDILTAGSVDEALRMARGPESFIAGGADLYRQSLDRADRLYITRIERDYEGDVLFPEFDRSRWRLTEEERHEAHQGEPAFRFETYDRIV